MSLKMNDAVQLQFPADDFLCSLEKGSTSLTVSQTGILVLYRSAPDPGIALVPHKLAVRHLVPSSSDPETANSLN